MVTVKELLMALPNKKRLEIWEMLKIAKEDITAYGDDDTIENLYDAIIKEVCLHVEVEQGHTSKKWTSSGCDNEDGYC